MFPKHPWVRHWKGPSAGLGFGEKSGWDLCWNFCIVESNNISLVVSSFSLGLSLFLGHLP